MTQLKQAWRKQSQIVMIALIVNNLFAIVSDSLQVCLLSLILNQFDIAAESK